MTKTAMKNKELDLKADELSETKRHNKRQENLQKADIIAGNILRGVTSFIPKFSIRNLPTGKSNNDIHWYTNMMGADVLGKFPTYFPIGGPRSWQAGLLKLSYLDTVGTQSIYPTEIPSNPVNIGLAALQAKLRQFNSRIGEYEPGDLGQWLISATSLHCTMKLLYLAIAAAKFFDGENIAIGDQIIIALGFTPNDLRRNRANYEAFYHEMSSRINESIVIPTGWSYYDRKLYACGNMFTDNSRGKKSQMYMWVPYGYFLYNEEESIVEYDQYTPFGTLSDFSNLVGGMWQNLALTAISTTLVADLRDALKGNYRTIPTSVDADIKYFTGDTIVRLQTQNMQLPEYCTIQRPYLSNLYIKQDTNGSIYQGDLIGSGINQRVQYGKLVDATGVSVNRTDWINDEYLKSLFNRFESDWTPEDVIEANVQNFDIRPGFLTNGSNNDDVVSLEHCGTEVFFETTIYKVRAPLAGGHNLPASSGHMTAGTYVTFTATIDSISFVGKFVYATINQYLVDFNWRPQYLQISGFYSIGSVVLGNIYYIRGSAVSFKTYELDNDFEFGNDNAIAALSMSNTSLFSFSTKFR